MKASGLVLVGQWHRQCLKRLFGRCRRCDLRDWLAQKGMSVAPPGTPDCECIWCNWHDKHPGWKAVCGECSRPADHHEESDGCAYPRFFSSIEG
jgi:hypothetical protein